MSHIYNYYIVKLNFSQVDIMHFRYCVICIFYEILEIRKNTTVKSKKVFTPPVKNHWESISPVTPGVGTSDYARRQFFSAHQKLQNTNLRV